jgi:hypothetical protein
LRRRDGSDDRIGVRAGEHRSERRYSRGAAEHVLARTFWWSLLLLLPLLVWLPWCLGFFGVSFGWWFDVGQWSITHILRLPEHFVDSPTAGNVLTHYVSTAVFVLVSTALATIWLAVDRRGITYPIAFVCAFVLARFLLAGYMMGYGWIKVLPAQFGRMASGAGTDYLMQQVGQLPPTDLLWAFMEASRPYQVFAGKNGVWAIASRGESPSIG